VRFLLFGGTNDADWTLNDLHQIKVSFALGSSERGAFSSSPVIFPAGGLTPSPRNGMTLTSVDVTSSRFVLFGGGVYQEAYFNDMYLLDMAQQLNPRLPAPVHHTAIVSHLASLVGSSRFSDVDIELDGELVPAHRMLLCSGASSYFDLALEEGGFREASEAATGRVSLGLPGHIQRTTLMAVLRWIYTGALPWDQPIDGEDPSQDVREQLLELIVAADALGMDALREVCEGQLVVSSESVLELFSFAERCNCNLLRHRCLTDLRERFGALCRAALLATDDDVARAGGVNGWRTKCEEVHAAELALLDGFDNLSEPALEDIACHLGLPVGGLGRRRTCDAGDAQC